MEVVCGNIKNGVVIPTDWLSLKVDDVMSFSGGSQPPRNTFVFNQKKGFIRLLQIRDYKTDKYETFIPLELAQKFCEKGDIMIGRYGPPIFQILRGFSGAYNVALIKVLPKPRLDREFAYYFLKQDKLFRFVEKLSQRSSGQTGVDLVELKGYPLPLPPTITEQKAIATALSDVDALISNLEKFITKKKAIKQGAKQQLLTGKKRLPGFEKKKDFQQTEIGEIPMDWGINLLSEVVDFLDGQRRPIKSNERKSGIYPYYGASGIIDYVDDYIFDDEVILLGEDGENILSRNLPLAFRAKGKIWVNNHAHVLKPKSQFDIIYLTDYLESLDYTLLNSGTAQPKLNKQACSNIRIVCPTLAEQKAIATTLSDMDREVKALESKKAKYQQIKQGMMQDLLTGKTRLV